MKIGKILAVFGLMFTILLVFSSCAKKEPMVVERVVEAERVARVSVPTIDVKDGWSYGYIAYPTGELHNSVVLFEKVMPEMVKLNENFSYNIFVTNISEHSIRQNAGWVRTYEVSQMPAARW